MADLIIYLPNHGYVKSDKVYVSWLDLYGYARDTDKDGVTQNVLKDSFKVSTDDTDDNIVQFTTTVNNGYVREWATGSATVSGLDHLEGEIVKVTAGGSIIATETVSGGQITLPESLSAYQVGLPYTMKVRTTRLSVPNQEGTLQTRIKRINETVVRHLRSKGGESGQEYDGVEYLTDIDASYSDDSSDETILTKGGFTPDAYTTVISDEPYPFTLLSTIVSFEVEERR